MLKTLPKGFLKVHLESHIANAETLYSLSNQAIVCSQIATREPCRRICVGDQACASGQGLPNRPLEDLPPQARDA